MTDDASPPVLPRRLDYLRLSEIRGAERNPKVHDVDGIAASISEHGMGELPLYDDRTDRLVAGHGRINDLRERYARGEDPPEGVVADDDGEWRVPVIRGWRSKDDLRAVRYLIGSNGLTMSGGWDDGGLAELLSELRAVDVAMLEGTGFNDGDVDDLLALAAPPDLDQLGGDHGDPDASDTWPVVRVKVPPHMHAAWRTVVDEHDGDELTALAGLLEISPEPGESGPTWQPDRLAS